MFKNLILPICIALLFAACSKDDDSPQASTPTTTVPEVYISLKINGTKYTYDKDFALLWPGKHIHIKGKSSSKFDNMGILLTYPFTSGERELKNKVGSSYINFFGEGDTNYYSHEGKLNITLIDTINKKVSGTFNFKAAEHVVTYNTGDTAVIEDGVFNVSYQ